MDRKGLLIIVITLAAAFSLNYFWLGPQREREMKAYKERVAKWEAEQKAKADAEKKTTPEQPVANAQATPAVEKPAAPVVPAVPEEKKQLSSEAGTVDYLFSSYGAGITRVVLKEHLEDKKKNTPIVLNEFGSIPIGAMAEQPGDDKFLKLPWTVNVDEASRTVSFERTDEVRKIKIAKKFSLPRKPDETDARKVKLRSEYLVALDVTYTNLGTGPMMVPKYFFHLGGIAPVSQHELSMQYQGFDYWRDGSNTFTSVATFLGGGIIFKDPERPEIREEQGLIRWSAVTNQYFTTMFTVIGWEGKSDDEQRPNLGVTVWGKRTPISPDDWRKPNEWRPSGHELSGDVKLSQVDAAIGIPEFALDAGKSATRQFQIYAGPREYRRLRLLDHSEKDVLNYGSFLGIPTGPFSRLLLNTMNWLQSFVGSYALAIVLLTIIVKAILWPLQNKANKSMKKMAELNPQIKAMQEKYKAEPQKFQQEMGKIWKKAGVNPLSGCWPIFIQIPVFIGFYNMLGKAVELRHHGFLWVQDLAAPDTVGHLLGVSWMPINPLPLFMALTMWYQMKMAPAGGDPAQRKIFMFMPVIFLVMCYSFASALALYWTVQNIISIVQLMLNRDKNAAVAQPAPAK